MAANNLVVGVVIARWLGADGLGTFAVLSVTVINVVQIGSLGLPGANTYFVAQDRRLLASVAINSLVFATVVGVALGGVTLAVLNSSFIGGINFDLALITAIYIPLQLITFLGLSMFLAVERPGYFNALETINQSCVVINATLALVVFGAGLLMLFALNVAASMCVSIALVWLMRKQILAGAGRVRWSPDWSLFRRMMSYSARFHVVHVAGLLVFRADLLLVNFFRGASEAGVYSVAGQAALLLMILPNAIGLMLFPRVAAMGDASAEFTCRLARRTAFIMFVACLAAIPASLLLPFVYGQEFAESSVQLLLLLPGVFCIGIEMVLVQHFSGTGMPGAIPLFWVATLVVYLALNFALVPVYGGRGAAIASTLGYGLIFALVALRFRRETGQSFAAMLLLRDDELREIFARRSFAQ